MAYRNFKDRDGHTWEVRATSKREWTLEPIAGNPGRARSVASPGYEKDPFELSVEELQKLLDGGTAPPMRNIKSPFKE